VLEVGECDFLAERLNIVPVRRRLLPVASSTDAARRRALPRYPQQILPRYIYLRVRVTETSTGRGDGGWEGGINIATIEQVTGWGVYIRWLCRVVILGGGGGRGAGLVFSQLFEKVSPGRTLNNVGTYICIGILLYSLLTMHAGRLFTST